MKLFGSFSSFFFGVNHNIFSFLALEASMAFGFVAFWNAGVHHDD